MFDKQLALLIVLFNSNELHFMKKRELFQALWINKGKALKVNIISCLSICSSFSISLIRHDFYAKLSSIYAVCIMILFCLLCITRHNPCHTFKNKKRSSSVEFNIVATSGGVLWLLLQQQQQQWRS